MCGGAGSWSGSLFAFCRNAQARQATGGTYERLHACIARVGARVRRRDCVD
jgi:hypothetical protein